MWVQIPHTVIVIAASMKMWVSKHAGGQRMRSPSFFSFACIFLHLLELEPTQARQRIRNQSRYARADFLIRRIISVAGCHLTLSISLYKNRKVLSESSFGNKTRDYSYPVWRRIK